MELDKLITLSPDKLYASVKVFERAWAMYGENDTDSILKEIEENLTGSYRDYAFSLLEAKVGSVKNYMGTPVYYSGKGFSAPKHGIYGVESKPQLKKMIQQKTQAKNERERKSAELKRRAMRKEEVSSYSAYYRDLLDQYKNEDLNKDFEEFAEAIQLPAVKKPGQTQQPGPAAPNSMKPAPATGQQTPATGQPQPPAQPQAKPAQPQAKPAAGTPATGQATPQQQNAAKQVMQQQQMLQQKKMQMQKQGKLPLNMGEDAQCNTCADKSGNTEKGKSPLPKNKKVGNVTVNPTVQSEKIDVGSNIRKTIKDFVHSSDERFSGDTKKERIKKAIGAYYGAKNESIDEAKKNDGNLANNYPPYDKVTRGDVIAGRLGKDEMGGKKKSTKKEEVEQVDELYKGKHGQSETEYQDSRSNAGKMVSGTSKLSGAAYSYRGVKNTGPNPAGGSEKPKAQGRMTSGQRTELQYRKANLMKKEEVEVVDEAMSSYDRNRKRAAQRAADRNAARDRGQTGNVPGVGYVSPRRERETYTDESGQERHKSGARMPKKEDQKESVDLFDYLQEKNGLYANIHAKRRRGEPPAKPGHEDYPAKDAFKKAARTAKKEEVEVVSEEDPCWKGYTQVGMKKKGGREVPNCVPSKGVPKAKGYKKEDIEMLPEEDYDRLKDRRLEKGGMDGNTRYPTKPAAPMSAQDKEKHREASKKALELVKKSITAKYGAGALMGTKKESVNTVKKSNAVESDLDRQLTERGVNTKGVGVTEDTIQEDEYRRLMAQERQTERKREQARPGRKSITPGIRAASAGRDYADSNIKFHAKVTGKTTTTEESLHERGDYWHPDPDEDRKLGGPGANQRAREDRAAASKPKEDPKKLRPGESYLDYSNRITGKSSTPSKPSSLRDKIKSKLGLKMSYEPEGELVDEGKKELKQRNKNEMQRKAGNLGREVVSTPNTKKNAPKRDAAMNRMKKLVSVIARDDEEKRFKTIGQSPLHNSFEMDGDELMEITDFSQHPDIKNNPEMQKKAAAYQAKKAARNAQKKPLPPSSSNAIVKKEPEPKSAIVKAKPIDSKSNNAAKSTPPTTPPTTPPSDPPSDVKQQGTRPGNTKPKENPTVVTKTNTVVKKVPVKKKKNTALGFLGSALRTHYQKQNATVKSMSGRK